jgi:hypothetical protein
MNKVIQLLFILHLVLIEISILNAQSPTMEWHKGYGTNNEEHVHEGVQTTDGGYIAVGHTWEGSTQYTDILVVKTSSNGTEEWEEIIGTSGQYDVGICVLEVSDGYLVGGAIHNGNQQRGLAKLDFAGNVIWEKTYPNTASGCIRGIDGTSDGAIVATGYKNSPEEGYLFIADDSDGFIMKLDTSGTIIWEKDISVTQGTKVRQEVNGCFAIASTDWFWNGSDHQDVVLIKTDSNGDEFFINNYGGADLDQCFDFDLCSDGGYIFAGHTLSFGVVNWDYYLLKVDSDGNEEWFKTFGQPRGYDAQYIHDEAYGVRETSDGGFIVAGGSGDEYTYSGSGHPSGPSDEWKAYLVRTDNSGNKLWEEVYPPTSVGNNAGEYIDITSDNGYVVFTDTDSQRPPVPNNFGIMKISTDPITNIYNDDSIEPMNFSLKQNRPNPFNQITTIQYSIAEGNKVILKIYDALGNEIDELVNENKEPGIYSLQFDGSKLASGIYIGKLQAGGFSSTIKMIFIK